MAKISREASKMHDQAVALIENGRQLLHSEKLFVLEHWNPQASHNVGKTGTFFTPIDLACDFAAEVVGVGILVDACAGIGTLSFAEKIMSQATNNCKRHICLEINPEFVKVGKRILPEVEWIEADVFDAKTWERIGKIDEVISNPPFVKVDPINFTPRLKSPKGVYAMAEIAMRYAKRATFIVDQGSCPFVVSGRDFRKEVENSQYKKFREATGVWFEETSIDTSYALDDWEGVKTQVEIVTVRREQ